MFIHAELSSPPLCLRWFAWPQMLPPFILVYNVTNVFCKHVRALTYWKYKFAYLQRFQSSDPAICGFTNKNTNMNQYLHITHITLWPFCEVCTFYKRPKPFMSRIRTIQFLDSHSSVCLHSVCETSVDLSYTKRYTITTYGNVYTVTHDGASRQINWQIATNILWQKILHCAVKKNNTLHFVLFAYCF